MAVTIMLGRGLLIWSPGGLLKSIAVSAKFQCVGLGEVSGPSLPAPMPPADRVVLACLDVVDHLARACPCK